MNYQVITPPPPLKNYVCDFWALENLADDDSQKNFAVLCNGLPGLIFQENPALFTGFAGERLPQLFVFGQARKHEQLQGGGHFQTSLALMRQGRFRSLTAIAHSLDYFDQSHFIRDFKLFSGVSPSIYLGKAIERMPGFPEWQS